jgi:hypothetical protein
MENLSLRDVIRSLEKDINYKKEVIDSIEQIADKKNREHLPLIHENQALKKMVDDLNHNIDHAYSFKDGKTLSLNDLRKFYHNHQDDAEAIKRMRKEADALNLNIYENVMLKKDNNRLEIVIKELKQEVKDFQDDRDNAYFLADGSTLSVNDLRTFYHENKNLSATMKENETIRADLEKNIRFHQMLVYNKDKQIVSLVHEKAALKKENEALKEGHKNKDQFIDSLRKEIEALNYNIDHAYKDGDKFLTVDDLCVFYQENKNVHDLAERQRNRMVLLELELKQLQKPKDETFATNTEEKFAERAKINQEKQNVKFEGYTEGFWKGFDMGYSKARDQFYE